MTQLQTIATAHAPGAVGPYSQAIKVGSFVFCSGQIALDPAKGTLVGDDVAAQTRQVLANLSAVLAEAGSSLQHVVKTTVFMADMKDFAAMNAVYADVFGNHRPARSTFGVVELPKAALVEIEAIALVP